jgi:hypothetical protein
MTLALALMSVGSVASVGSAASVVGDDSVLLAGAAIEDGAFNESRESSVSELSNDRASWSLPLGVTRFVGTSAVFKTPCEVRIRRNGSGALQMDVFYGGYRLRNIELEAAALDAKGGVSFTALLIDDGPAVDNREVREYRQALGAPITFLGYSDFFVGSPWRVG